MTRPRRSWAAAFFLIALGLLAPVATAEEIKFRTLQDLTSNLDVKNQPNSFRVEPPGEAAGGGPPVLVYTAAKNVTAVAVRRPRGSAKGAPPAAAMPVSAEFRMTAPSTSFGVIVHATKDLSDGYLVLVNAYGNGGTIRVFRAPVWPQQQDMKLLGQKHVPVELGKWLRLTVNTAATDAGAMRIEARLAPVDGEGAKPAELNVEETHEPLAAGLTGLRFYSVDEGNKTLVRSLSIGPATAASPKGAAARKGTN